MTDLSKAFDSIDYNLFIAKLDAYGFEKQSIDFLHSYLTKRKHRTKVDSAYISWKMLISGVPQGVPQISAICFLKRQKILISHVMHVILTHVFLFMFLITHIYNDIKIKLTK